MPIISQTIPIIGPQCSLLGATFAKEHILGTCSCKNEMFPCSFLGATFAKEHILGTYSWKNEHGHFTYFSNYVHMSFTFFVKYVISLCSIPDGYSKACAPIATAKSRPKLFRKKWFPSARFVQA